MFQLKSLEEALRLANEPAQPKQAPQTPNAERAREIADGLDRVMAEQREVGQPLACAAAPPPLHDETVPMREYDEDAYNIRYEPVLRGASQLPHHAAGAVPPRTSRAA